MYDDGFEADQLQKGHVLDDAPLQVLVHHGASAVFHYDNLPVKPLDIGKGLNEDLGFLQVGVHFFSAHNIFSSVSYER